MNTEAASSLLSLWVKLEVEAPTYLQYGLNHSNPFFLFIILDLLNCSLS